MRLPTELINRARPLVEQVFPETRALYATLGSCRSCSKMRSAAAILSIIKATSKKNRSVESLRGIIPAEYLLEPQTAVKIQPDLSAIGRHMAPADLGRASG